MAGKKQNVEVSNKAKIKCVLCGKEKIAREFYSSNKGEHIVLQGKAPYCKECITNDVIIDKITGQISREKFIDFLALIDRPFIPDIYKDVIPTSTTTNLVKKYVDRLNLKGYKDLIYIDTERFSEVLNADKSLDINNFVQTLNESAIKSKEDILKLLGYDPFEEYQTEDKNYLYNELIPYLDEDTLEDPFKCGVILQIVINNNFIRKANISINSLGKDMMSMIKNSKEISALTDMTTKWNQQNDKLSKENNIALKHRGDSSSKNSTLGSMMKNLRELDFEKAEHDYYDMMKAHGMQVSADISNKSIMQIVHFDDADMNNMFKSQREELQKLQNKELEYREEIRKLCVQNSEQAKKIKELENIIKDMNV